MKLTYSYTSKDPIYYIQQGIRNGKKTTTKTIKRIGKHSELLKITDDPLAYAKAEVKKYNEEYEAGKISLEHKIDLNENVAATSDKTSKKSTQNIGYFILQKIYSEIGISSFFRELNKENKSSYKFDDVNRFLTFARILDPKSKHGTYENLSNFFAAPDLKYEQIMRFLDVLESNSADYVKMLFEGSKNTIKRNLSICYLDYTNYYFETQREDEDFVDESTGEIIKGLRKYGMSKENRPNPLVQMGLFMDADGIPISMEINSGSDNENKGALNLEKELVKMIGGKSFVYCADAGLNSINLRKYNSLGGRAFVVSQSVKKLSEEMQEKIFNDFDYRLIGSNKRVKYSDLKALSEEDEKDYTCYKVFNVDKSVDLGLYETKILKNGKVRKMKSKALLPQKLIVTFSVKSMIYQRNIRDKQIARAQRLIDTNLVEKSKKGMNDARRFITRESKILGEAKGKNEVQDVYNLDAKKIREEEKFDGFYAIATNLDDDIETIISINKNRYKIEECFRVLKSNFSARPIYHNLPNRITAHFLVCFTALTIFRILQKKLDKEGTHFTTKEIIETLKNMEVHNSKDMFYEAVYTGSDLLNNLEQVFGLGLNKRYHEPKEIRKKIKKISK